MTRFRFLAGLLGLGAAAQAQTPDTPIYGRIVEYRNGMCPVCGTMAEPYKEQPGILARCPATPDYPRGYTWIKRDHCRVDCAKCGNTFRQDAEAEK